MRKRRNARAFVARNGEKKHNQGKTKDSDKATMTLQVEILPVIDADATPLPPLLGNPGGTGLGFIAERKGRVGYDLALSDPMKFATIIIGKKNKTFLYKSCVCTFIILLIVTFLVITYLLLNTYLPAIKYIHDVVER